MEDTRAIENSETPLKHMNSFYSGIFSPVQNSFISTLMKSSTPINSIQKLVKKPRVNFHSIDDIVNGGKGKKN